MGDLAGVRQSGENLEGLSGSEADVELLIAARDLLREHPSIGRSYAGAGVKERLIP